MINLKKYSTLIFDCDGVILNSNKIKTKSFKKILKGYNQNAIEEFIKYHKKNGGISRYIKLSNFLNVILTKYELKYEPKKNELENLINKYGYECKHELFKSEVTQDLYKLREYTGDIPWLIVSGGDQIELREVFDYKKIYQYFNGGIYGSPDKKIEIIKRELIKGKIKQPALMLGDSKLDHVAAKQNNIDFIFVSEWTDFEEYKVYCESNFIKIIPSISDLISN